MTTFLGEPKWLTPFSCCTFCDESFVELDYLGDSSFEVFFAFAKQALEDLVFGPIVKDPLYIDIICVSIRLVLMIAILLSFLLAPIL